MPPKNRFTKEEIIDAAIQLVREEGMQALTARGLALRLGSSAKPIFGWFRSMEEVQQAVLFAANERYEQYLEAEKMNGKYPPYKAMGMGYIRFAGEERALFQLLFMRDRTGETIEKEDPALRPIIEIIQKQTGLEAEKAARLHLETWIYVHGIAAMIATGYLQWDTDMASSMLTDIYQSLRKHFQEESNERH